MSQYIEDRVSASADFTLKDIVVGKSVLSGMTTSGSLNYGTVMQIIPGVGFCVDNGYWPSILWRDLRLHSKDMPRNLDTGMGINDEVPTTAGLRRTDSGYQYGMPGYPDYEFWEKQGIEAPFVAVRGVHYYPVTYPTYKEDIRNLLLTKGMPEDDAAKRAWIRQMNSLSE